MSEAILIKVEGMSCAGCVRSVERAVRAVDPNADVSVDLDKGEVHIAGSKAESQSFAVAIEKAGYDVSH